jgi:alpha-beta hydrolase superfamily lysophospholipase
LSPDASDPGTPEASPPPREGPSRPRRRRWIALAAGLAAVLAALVGGLTAWHFSGNVVVPDHSPWPEDVTVEALRPGQIVLERTDQTARPGYLGLTWPSGHAQVGPVLAEDDDTVTRRLIAHDGYLVPDRQVGLDLVYVGDPEQAHGLPFSTVDIRGELGPMPAWLVPGRGGAASDTWAIYVHGINGTPEGGLGIAPLLRRLGISTLYITYREDQGAPSSPDGHHHMGLTEWRDLQSAVRYALAHGARRLVLFGTSMGGAIVTRFMEASPLADRARALILDAPALNWKRILEFNATEMGFPAFAALPVEWAVGARIDADWEDADALGHTEDLHLPILLFHGLADDLIPIGTSDDLAEALPHWVTYYRVPEAEHAQAWNVDPPLYEARVTRFLRNSLQIEAKEKGPTGVGP